MNYQAFIEAEWYGVGPDLRAEPDGALLAVVSPGMWADVKFTNEQRDRLAKRIAREHNAIDLIAQIAERNDDATYRRAVLDILDEYRLNWQSGKAEA